MNRAFLRRRYIVDWKLQGSLCAHGLLYGGLVLAAVSGGIFVPLLWDLSGTTELGGFEEQAIVLLYMHERFWFLALLCAGIVILGAIKFSHRIAGPLVRYKRNLRLVAGGQLPPPLRTRPGDYLQEEVSLLNAAVAGIAARIEAIRKAQLTVRAEVAAVVERTPPESACQLEALVEASCELERRVAVFAAVDPGDDRPPAVANVPEPVLAATGATGS